MPPSTYTYDIKNLPINPSLDIPGWRLVGKMKAKFPQLSKFNYHHSMVIGITTDHKLLSIEEDSTEITEYINFRGKEIKDIACGSEHFMVLTEDSELHSWGGNRYGQLGLGDTEPRSEPTRVNIENIDQIKCADYYSMALTFDGECYHWGVICRLPTPTKLELPSGVKFKQIDCSPLLALALGTDNRAYGWGLNIAKLTGLFADITHRTTSQPIKVPLEEDIKSVACNWYHCVFLTFEGKLYHNIDSTSGRIVPIHTSAVFERVLSFPKSMFLAMQADGKIFVWGRTKQGKLQTPTVTGLPLAQSITKYYKQFKTSMMDIDDFIDHLPIAEQIAKLFDSETRSDIEFIFPAEGKSIKAHKFVLTLNSDYMRTQLSEHWCTSGKVNIKEWSYTQYYNYIRFMYMRHIKTNNLEEAFDLLKLFKCFLEKSLETECCEHILSEYLNRNTCATIHEFFAENSYAIYEKKVAKFMQTNYCESNHTILFYWPLLGKMMTQFPRLSKFRYHFNKMFGITTDHKLLFIKFIESNSTKMTEYKKFRGKVIKDIVCESYHFMVLTGDGEVYSWGDNSFGQLGLGHRRTRRKPTRVNIENIDQIKCADYYSMALTFDGECYHWGNICYLPTPKRTPTKLELPSGVKFKQIDCSGEFSLALGTDNRAYGWGKNWGYFAGLPSVIPQPTKLPLEENIKSVTCSNAHEYVFLTFGGKLYHNSISADGRIVPIDTSAVFKKVFTFSKDIFLGVQTDGKIFVWGHTRRGPLETPTETGLPLAQSIAEYYRKHTETSMMMDIDDFIVQPTIAEQMSKLFDSGENSDIEFIFPAEGKSIKAHRFVLTLNSDYMRTQLSEHWSTSAQVNIEEWSYAQFYHYIHFLYTQRIMTYTLQEAFDLLKLFKCFLEKALAGCCEHILDEYLNLKTCVTIYEFFVNNSYGFYEEKVAKFMKANYKKLYKQPNYRRMNVDICKKFSLRFLHSMPKSASATLPDQDNL